MVNKNKTNSDTSQKASAIAKKLTTQKPEIVVGVGASAGGLAALKSLCAHLPTDIDAAVIIVQHLSPDFTTYMDELLKKPSTMPVKFAEDLEPLQANTIYLMGSRKVVTVAEGRIILSDPDDRPIHHPIDYLFRSIAEECQNDAVGIVLSGTGNDGSRGLLDLKTVDALVIAQDPATAEFDGMPMSAIKAGNVDLVLPPEEIGPQLKKYMLNRQQDAPSSKALTAEKLRHYMTIFEKVSENSKIDLRSYKQSTVERRIQHRMGILGINSLAKYTDYIQREDAEKKLLIDDISIGVTQFFRNPETWKDFSEHYLEKLILQAPSEQSFRVWVPGCSSGEEAYTIAILFEEVMERLGEQRDFRIFASDIDRSSIRFAGIALYPRTIEQDIPSHLLEKYFVNDESGYLVTEKIRNRVVFASHNLLEDPPFSNMDLVSCRNLLIYFQVHAQKDILSFLHFALKPEGYLLLGEAETTSSLPEYFDEIDRPIRLYQRAKNTKIKLSNVGLSERLEKHSLSLKVSRANTRPSNRFDGTVPKLKEQLINLHVPATIVLDHNQNIVFSVGDTDPYTKKIQPGSHSMHFSRLLCDSLVTNVGSLLKQVDDRNKRILLTDVAIKESDLLVSIDASTCPWVKDSPRGIISFLSLSKARINRCSGMVFSIQKALIAPIRMT